MIPFLLLFLVHFSISIYKYRFCYNHFLSLYHSMLSFNPSLSLYRGTKPKSSRTGVMSHFQFLCLRILYLSVLNMVLNRNRRLAISDIRHAIYTIKPGNLKCNTDFLPTSSCMFAANSLSVYTSPSDRRYSLFLIF